MEGFRAVRGMCFDCMRNDTGFCGDYSENADCPHQDADKGECWLGITPEMLMAANSRNVENCFDSYLIRDAKEVLDKAREEYHARNERKVRT